MAGADLRDRETQFPLCDTSEGFNKAKDRIKRLSPEAQAEIEQLQPYNTQGGGDKLALLVIQKIDNADKHKLLPVAVVMPEQIDIKLFPVAKEGSTQNVTIFPREFVHDARVATYTIFPPVPTMEVRFKFTPQVMFDQIEGFNSVHYVLPNLELMLKSVDEVIKRMTNFFPSTEQR